MKILHVVTGLRKASGVTTFVENLTAELLRDGHVADIVTKPQEGGVLMRDLARYQIVHIHGLWDLWLHRWVRVARKAGAKVVWSPHGMLQPWALKNKWWKKFAALAFYQWWDLRLADALHVTAQSEVRDVRRLGLNRPVVVAPLGVRSARAGTEEKTGRSRILLFVSRVQRKKGLPTLLTAWARIPSAARAGWQIRIVGPDQDNHTAELKALAVALGIADTVVFVGPKYDAELADEYRAADLFALPTHSENFGSVVVEALSNGLPVVCTREAPWEELETRQCGWWVEDSVDGVFGGLWQGLRMSDVVRREMGLRGRKLVEEKYTWKAVCRALVEGYRKVVASRQ